MSPIFPTRHGHCVIRWRVTTPITFKWKQYNRFRQHCQMFFGRGRGVEELGHDASSRELRHAVARSVPADHLCVDLYGGVCFVLTMLRYQRWPVADDLHAHL